MLFLAEKSRAQTKAGTECGAPSRETTQSQSSNFFCGDRSKFWHHCLQWCGSNLILFFLLLALRFTGVKPTSTLSGTAPRPPTSRFAAVDRSNRMVGQYCYCKRCKCLPVC